MEKIHKQIVRVNGDDFAEVIFKRAKVLKQFIYLLDNEESNIRS